jgi:hypothetical protein
MIPAFVVGVFLLPEHIWNGHLFMKMGKVILPFTGGRGHHKRVCPDSTAAE